MKKSQFTNKINSFGLGKHETEVALAAFNDGKKHKTFEEKGKVSDINVRYCKTQKQLTVKKKILRNGIKQSETENIYNLVA